MTIETIKELRDTSPFKPFTIRTADSQGFEVPHQFAVDGGRWKNADRRHSRSEISHPRHGTRGQYQSLSDLRDTPPRVSPRVASQRCPRRAGRKRCCSHSQRNFLSAIVKSAFRVVIYEKSTTNKWRRSRNPSRSGYADWGRLCIHL
jgi:hypothetical protein